MPDQPTQPQVDLRKTLLTVHVGSPDRVFFDGQAMSVSTHNDRGDVDILPAHENFISIIKEKLIIIDQSNKRNELKIDTAVMRVSENRVDIFIGIPSIDVKKLTPTKIKDRLASILSSK